MNLMWMDGKAFSLNQWRAGCGVGVILDEAHTVKGKGRKGKSVGCVCGERGAGFGMEMMRGFCLKPKVEWGGWVTHGAVDRTVDGKDKPVNRTTWGRITE